MSEITTLNNGVSKILRALAESAAREICNLVQDNCATLFMELYQSKGEINKLKRSLELAESTRETLHNVTYSQRNGSDMEYEDKQIHDDRESNVTAAASATGVKELVSMAPDIMKTRTSVGPQTTAALNKLKAHDPPPAQHRSNNQNTLKTRNSDSSPSEYEGEKTHNDGESDLTCVGSLSSWRTVATSATGITVLVPMAPDTMKSQTSASDKMKSQISLGPQPTATSNKLKRHVTCFPIGESPKVEQCTSCCSLYHCPFCQPSVFKPSEYHRIIPHLQSHLKSTIRTNEFVIYKCRLTCRVKPHFHCCSCENIKINRSDMVKHIMDCQKVSKSHLPPASAQGGPPPPPHPSPSTPPPGPPHPLDSGPPHSTSSSTPHPPPAQHPPNNQKTSQTLNSESSPSLLPCDVSPTQSTGSSPHQPSEANQTLEEVHGMDSELKSLTLEPSSHPPATHYMEASPTFCPSMSPLPLQHVDEIPTLPLHPSPPNVLAQETKNMPSQSTGETVASKQFKEDCLNEPKSMMKIMCELCGIILRRKNYKVHMRRRHKEEFKAMVQEVAQLEETREFKVISQCHICGILLQKRNYKKHLQRSHKEEFILDAFHITLKGINHTRCQRCGVLVKARNFRKHMKSKHQEKVTMTSYQDALNLFVADRGLLMVESSQPSSPTTADSETESEEEGRDVGKGKEREWNWLSAREENTAVKVTGFPKSSGSLTFEPTNWQQRNTVLTLMNAQWYPRLGKPHFQEIPLEAMVYIFREVICAEGPRGYWNLSLVCKTFRSILRNEVIKKYAFGQTS